MGKLAILQIRRPDDLDDPICQKCAKLNAKFGNTPDYISEAPISDFAVARNQLQQDAISHDGEIEWFLWIDTDEVFPFRVDTNVTTTMKMGFSFKRYNLFIDVSHYLIDSGCYPDWQTRIINNKCYWSGKIHEGVVIDNGSIIPDFDRHIYHYGWLRDKQWQEQKHARFHTIAGKEPNWRFPSIADVRLKLLPKEKVITL